MLYSREFLEAAREHLKPGGVYSQWMQQYEIDVKSLELVLRTYASVFDRVSVWYGTGVDLLLLGFRDAEHALDVERLAERAARPDFASGLERHGLAGLPELLAHELLPLDVVGSAGFEGPLHTLHHPRLNHIAARAFFRGEMPELPFTGYGAAARAGARNGLARRYLASLPEAERDAVRARIVGEACLHRNKQCTTMLAEWGDRDPDSKRFDAQLAAVARRNPSFGGRVDRRTSARLAAWFFGPEEPGGAEVSPGDAARATRYYERYYHHAAPFDSGRLLEIWSRCRDGSSGCIEGEARARALVNGPGPVDDGQRADFARPEPG
jgi:hypothetical protein